MISNPEGGFHSTLFLVPKKDGGQRPVINLKALNSFSAVQHLKMEGIHTLKDLLRPGDWLSKVDLKDAYFAVPIHPDHRKYLRFSVGTKTYQFTCLPFGLSSAPWVFTKTLRPVAALVQELGVRVIFYIDDILLMADSKERLTDQTIGLSYLLVSGFHHQHQKDNPRAYPVDRVSRLHCEYNLHGAEPPSIENEKDPGRSPKTKRGGVSIGPSPGSGSGQDEHDGPNYSSCTPVLSPSPERSIPGPESELPGLRHSPQSLPGQQGRVELVEYTDGEMERENNPSQRYGSSNRLGCLQAGLGSSLSGYQHGRTLVRPGEDHAHKLSGTAGSYFSPPNIYEEREGYLSAVEDRQHNSCSIHQQSGWNSIQGPDSTHLGPLDVVPGEEYPHPCPTPPGSPQPHC